MRFLKRPNVNGVDLALVSEINAGVIAIPYAVDLDVSAPGNPGDGVLLFSDTSGQVSSTTISVSGADSNSKDWNSILANLASSSNPVKGIIRLVKKSDATKQILFELLSVTLQSPNYYDLGVNGLGVIGSLFVDGDEIEFIFDFTGDKGDTGSPGDTGDTGDTGPTGAQGFPGGIEIPYLFSTTTTDSDPGTGTLRFDNNPMSSVTVIRADLTGHDGLDYTSILDMFDDSTSTIKGYIRVFKKNDQNGAFVNFSISSVATPSGYRNINVAFLNSSGGSPFANGDELFLSFSRTGDKGDTGATGSTLTPTLTEDSTSRTRETLTLGTTDKTGDGTCLSGDGLKWFGGGDSTAKIIHGLVDDLSTYSVETLDTSWASSTAGLQSAIYVPETGLIYMVWKNPSIDGGGFGIVVTVLDPANPSGNSILVLDDLGSTTVGSPTLASDGTHLAVLTSGATDSLFRRYLLSDGSFVDSQTLTGLQSGHALTFDVIQNRYYMGGRNSTNIPWVGWVDVNNTTHGSTTLTGSNGVEDDMQVIGDNIFVGGSSSCTLWKISVDLSSFKTFTLSGSSKCDGMGFDGRYLWLGDGASPARVMLFDPDNEIEIGHITLHSGENSVNELFFNGIRIWIATSTTAHKIIRLYPLVSGFGPEADRLVDASTLASTIHAAPGKTTPVNADEISLVDTAANNGLKKLTLTNFKAFLKTYFDTLYLGISATAAAATKLITARNIDGQSFDGTANITVIAPGTHAATSKTTPVNADEVPLVDTEASNVLKKLTLTNFKAFLKTYFDTLYPSGSGTSTGTNTGDQTTVSGNAGTATTLQTARNIDGQSFNGSANITVIAPGTHAATSKTTPVDADEVPLVDTEASNVLKKLTLTNFKAFLKTYFDTLYLGISATAAAATKLITARNIDGQSFDGTANITVIAPGTHAATSKTTPVDADEVPLVDTEASNVLKKLTLTNFKAFLKTYFDTLYVTPTQTWTVLKQVADQVVANQATLQDSNTFTISMTSGKTYAIRGVIFFETTATGDFKYGFSTPTVTRVRAKLRATAAGATPTEGAILTSLTASSALLATGGTGGYIDFEITFTAGSTASFKFQFAQNTQTNDAGAQVLKGSRVEYIQVD